MVASPSVVDGRQYRIISTASKILWIAEDPLPALLNRCSALGWQVKKPAANRNDVSTRRGRKKRLLGPSRSLSEIQKVRIINALVPFWQPGQRNTLCMYLTGLMAKRRINQENTREIVSRICELAQDEERSQRLNQVDYHYRKPLQAITRLKGLKGLEEVLLNE